MIPIEDRSQRIRDSALKIESPFELDETLCLYSPQDNVDSLSHPRIVEWLDFVQTHYQPKLPKAERTVLLFLPCTKTKPYPFSSEHRAINQRLFDAGFKPTGRQYLPQEMQSRLDLDASPEILNLSLLSNERGTVIHRMVISEPMGAVPYEHIVEFNGKPSPATSYDDPGLFENRGNAVSPWRSNSTAVQVSPTRWKWGDEERRNYVAMHNAMSEAVANVIARIGKNYTDIISWVAPGLTHRSFVVGRMERPANRIVTTRRVGAERLALVGANDRLGNGPKIECLPTPQQCKDAVIRLASRLGTSAAHATGVYSRGGVNATPLALPELLDVLIERLNDNPSTRRK
jgi:hypothetical protein